MAKTSWITADQVRTFAVRKTEFDTTIVEPLIYPTQVKYMRKFLGNDFYDEIHAEVEAASISTDNQTLLDDYLKPALAFFVIGESVIDQHYKLTNNGFVVNQSANDVAVEAKDIDIIRQNYFAKGNDLLAVAQQYIHDAQKSDSSKFSNYSSLISDDGRGATTFEYIPPIG